MLISDRIAAMINAMLREHGGTLDFRRNDMAERIGCSPSQINYVIRSRFSPEHGYHVESRRGEGGYVRIVQSRSLDSKEQLALLLGNLPSRLGAEEASAIVSHLSARKLIAGETAAVMQAALSSASHSADPTAISALLGKMIYAILRG